MPVFPLSFRGFFSVILPSHTSAQFKQNVAFYFQIYYIILQRKTIGLLYTRMGLSQIDSLVLSSIFRKFDSEKMKLCAGKPGEGAAKPRLIAAEHMTAAVSGAAKPFILTLDSAGGICYLIAALMPLLLRLRSDISYIDTAWFPTPFPKHTAVWHRPA